MFRSRHLRLLRSGLAAAALFAAAPAAAGGLVGVRALAQSGLSTPVASAATLDQGSARARLAFDLTAPVEASATVLDEPDRVVVDLPETAFVLDPALGRAGSLGRGLIRSYRFGAAAAGRSRVVIDLAGPARIVRVAAEPTPAGGASRLVIDLAATDTASFRASAAEARRRAANAAEPAKLSRVRPVVVLDPGHGGADTGATARDAADKRDVLEKTIVFDFAKALAARLEADGEVRCVMTRTDDTFIPLGERVRIAEEAGASLFVSIHADRLSEPGVQGATVYTLSDRASDAGAARVAEHENSSDRAAGLADQAEADGLKNILSDLTHRETRVLGRSFARGLVSAWREVGDLNKNPLRSAGFRVLRAADFPSVLFELGYLSNPNDLKNLSSPEWRDRAVARVAAAIERFMRAQPGEGSDMAAASRADATGSTR